MRVRNRWVGVAGSLLALGLVAAGQTPVAPANQMAKGAHPSFEVATIKLSDPASQRQHIGYEGQQGGCGGGRR